MVGSFRLVARWDDEAVDHRWSTAANSDGRGRMEQTPKGVVVNYNPKITDSRKDPAESERKRRAEEEETEKESNNNIPFMLGRLFGVARYL